MEQPVYRPKLDMSDWQQNSNDECKQIMAIVAPELHSFVAEHAALSSFMDRVREGYNEQVYEQALHAISVELEEHFRYEEDFVLAQLAKHLPATDVGPGMKLRQEHALIRRHHQEVSQLFQNRDDEKTAQELMQKMNLLAYLLKKHIEKEDHYFFPMVSLILTAEEKQEIAEQVLRADENR